MPYTRLVFFFKKISLVFILAPPPVLLIWLSETGPFY